MDVKEQLRFRILRVWITICENQAFIYTYSKQKVLSFGNDLATESNANVLSEILY